MSIRLGVVMIRDGRTTNLYDKHAILSGKLALMARSKVYFDVNFTDTPSVKPEDLHWEFGTGNGKTLEFLGSQEEVMEGNPWVLGGQGIDKLDDTHGYSPVVKYFGQGPGTGTAYAKVSFTYPDGTLTESMVSFPKAD